MTIHEGMSDGLYNQLDAERWTHVGAIDTSLRHYLWAKANGGISDTVSLHKGRAVHCSVLEPQRFESEYIVYPKRRQGHAWEDFRDANLDKCILNESESLSVRGMAANLLDPEINQTAPELLGTLGRREFVVTWTNKFSHMPCKARIDLLTEDGDKVEIKTAKSITPRLFGVQCHSLGYLGQDAFYREGLAANGIKVRNSYFVIVESKAPFDVAVYQVSDADHDVGVRLVGTLMRKLGMARQSQKWPGVCPGIMPLQLPTWAEGENLEMEVDGETESI